MSGYSLMLRYMDKRANCLSALGLIDMVEIHSTVAGYELPFSNPACEFLIT
jgi:hypothetical protein